MSGFKFLVVVLFIKSAVLNAQQHDPNIQMQQFPLYPNYNPYRYHPVIYSPPNFPMQMPPVEGHPFMYPPLANYHPYPDYPYYRLPYPSNPFYQPGLYNYPDPFAHIPTEIVDVDANFEDQLQFSWDYHQGQVEGVLSQQSIAAKTPKPSTHTSVVENKPVHTTITRIINPSAPSKPVSTMKSDDSNSKTGSGVVITADDEEFVAGNDNDDSGSEVKVEEQLNQTHSQDQAEEKSTGLFSWG